MSWNCYKHIKIKGQSLLEHRYIWEQANGAIPDGFEIHHINGDTFDNRLSNLQLVKINKHRSHHAIINNKLRPKQACLVEGCDNPYECNGYCKKHYYRVLRTGSPFGLKGHSNTNPACIV